LPAAPDAAWVTANATYVYVRPDPVPDGVGRPWSPTLHGRLDEPYRIMLPGFDELMDVVPCADAYGGCAMLTKDWVAQTLKRQ
jgi:hypothetical protein